MTEEKPKAKRGFALLSAEQRKKVAAMGGAAVPSDRRSFSQNKDLASNAGAKGGAAERKVGRAPKDQ